MNALTLFFDYFVSDHISLPTSTNPRCGTSPVDNSITLTHTVNIKYNIKNSPTLWLVIEKYNMPAAGRVVDLTTIQQQKSLSESLTLIIVFITFILMILCM